MPLNPRITDWHGKRVWLVGASTGIGRAVAALLHARGAQVCVSARQQALLDAFVREHPGSQALELDVTDAQAVASAARQLLAGGPLDLVCYCAGHYRPMSAHALDLPELLQHQSVNVTGALQVLAAGATLPLLQWLGYTPGSQDVNALQHLAWVYALLPCALKLVAASLLHWLLIDSPDHPPGVTP